MKPFALKFVTTAFLSASLALGAAPLNAGSSADLKLSGSSTVAPLMLEIGARYEDQINDDVRVFVETGGSSKGIADLRKDLADIAMVSRSLKSEESDLTAYTIARDGIAVVVHDSNPVANLSPDQVRDIFTGNITNWSQVGGPNQDIIVISKAEGRATFVVFNGYLGLKGSDIDADVIVGENVQMIKTVSQSEQAIGYVSIGAASVNIEFGSPIKLISLSDAEATVANVSNGSYQPTRPLNLVTKADPGEGIMQLIDYSKTDAVADLIVELTFSPATE